MDPRETKNKDEHKLRQKKKITMKHKKTSEDQNLARRMEDRNTGRFRWHETTHTINQHIQDK